MERKNSLSVCTTSNVSRPRIVLLAFVFVCAVRKASLNNEIIINNAFYSKISLTDCETLNWNWFLILSISSFHFIYTNYIYTIYTITFMFQRNENHSSKKKNSNQSNTVWLHPISIGLHLFHFGIPSNS